MVIHDKSLEKSLKQHSFHANLKRSLKISDLLNKVES